MEGLYAVITGIAVWFGLLQLWRATRYKAAYNELIAQYSHIVEQYDLLAAKHYARRERDRSFVSK